MAFLKKFAAIYVYNIGVCAGIFIFATLIGVGLYFLALIHPIVPIILGFLFIIGVLSYGYATIPDNTFRGEK